MGAALWPTKKWTTGCGARTVSVLHPGCHENGSMKSTAFKTVYVLGERKANTRPVCLRPKCNYHVILFLLRSAAPPNTHTANKHLHHQQYPTTHIVKVHIPSSGSQSTAIRPLAYSATNNHQHRQTPTSPPDIHRTTRHLSYHSTPKPHCRHTDTQPFGNHSATRHP